MCSHSANPANPCTYHDWISKVVIKPGIAVCERIIVLLLGGSVAQKVRAGEPEGKAEERRGRRGHLSHIDWEIQQGQVYNLSLLGG